MGSIRKAALVAAAAGALLMAGAGVASADSVAYGAAYNSPGVLSGNVVQIPIDVPINACGNSVNVVGLANPAFGNTCVNGGHENGSVSHHAHAANWHTTGWNHHSSNHHSVMHHSWNHDHHADCG